MVAAASQTPKLSERAAADIDGTTDAKLEDMATGAAAATIVAGTVTTTITAAAATGAAVVHDKASGPIEE